MNKKDYEYDIDTEKKHLPPVGLEHHTRRNNGKGRWYADIKMSHFVIAAHQEVFPDLAKKMKSDPDNATNIYSAFLAMLPLRIKGKLTNEIRNLIFKTYKV